MHTIRYLSYRTCDTHFSYIGFLNCFECLSHFNTNLYMTIYWWTDYKATLYIIDNRCDDIKKCSSWCTSCTIISPQSSTTPHSIPMYLAIILKRHHCNIKFVLWTYLHTVDITSTISSWSLSSPLLPSPWQLPLHKTADSFAAVPLPQPLLTMRYLMTSLQVSRTLTTIGLLKCIALEEHSITKMGESGHPKLAATRGKNRFIWLALQFHSLCH